ncbi:MAG: AMP-binding protein, partial [Acidimicrobiales bacterium]
MHGGLERAASRAGGRVALRAGGSSWTFAELDDLVNGTARHLASQGVGAGQRVAVMMANRVEFVATVLAASKLGAASVLVSPAWKSAEVGHALAVTSPVHAVGDRDAAPLLAALLGDGRVSDVDRRPGGPV